jgi:hypothetical protein
MSRAPRQGAGIGRAHRPGADEHRQAGCNGRDDEAADVQPFLDRLGIILAGGPARDQPVNPGGHQPFDQCGQRRKIGAAIGMERRDHRGIDPLQREPD